MNRLTYWNEEYGCWSYRCASGDAAKRLAAYEDTGLEPSEINELLSDIEKLLKFPRFVEAMMGSGDKALEV